MRANLSGCSKSPLRSPCCGMWSPTCRATNGPPALSGLKNQLRKRERGFSEKRFGYSGFLQFVRAAQNRGLVDFEWSDDAGDYLVTAED